MPYTNPRRRSKTKGSERGTELYVSLGAGAKWYGINLPDCAVTEDLYQPYQEAQAMPKYSHAFPDHWSTTFSLF